MWNKDKKQKAFHNSLYTNILESTWEYKTTK